jgi:hypothetical protein
MGSISAWAGEVTQGLLAPVAGLVRPWGGESAWGLAIMLVIVGWQLPLGHWVVRSAKARIVRAAVTDRVSVGRARGAQARRERRVQVRQALVARQLRTPVDLVVGRVIGVLSLFLALVVVVWSRTGEAAEGASFAGLTNLSQSPVRSGVAGVGWALALAAAVMTAQVVVSRVAGVRDERQRFFATRIIPVIFFGLGLFLPAATVVGFTVAMAVSSMSIVIAATDPALGDLAADRSPELVTL